METRGNSKVVPYFLSLRTVTQLQNCFRTVSKTKLLQSYMKNGYCWGKKINYKAELGKLINNSAVQRSHKFRTM